MAGILKNRRRSGLENCRRTSPTPFPGFAVPQSRSSSVRNSLDSLANSNQPQANGSGSISLEELPEDPPCDYEPVELPVENPNDPTGKRIILDTFLKSIDPSAPPEYLQEDPNTETQENTAVNTSADFPYPLARTSRYRSDQVISSTDKMDIAARNEGKNGVDNPAFAADEGVGTSNESTPKKSDLKESVGALKNPAVQNLTGHNNNRDSVSSDHPYEAVSFAPSNHFIKHNSANPRRFPTVKHNPGDVTFQVGKQDLDDSGMEDVKVETDTLIEQGKEETPEQREMRERKERGKSWNVFRILSHDNEHAGDDLCYEVVRKIFKVVTYIGVFILILAGTLISKATILFIAANMRQENYVECQEYLEQHNGSVTIKYKCMALYDSSTPESYPRWCLGKENGKKDRLPMCDAVTVRWIWAAILAVCTPYIFVALRSIWKIFFKRKKTPKFPILLLVLFVETLYAIGMSILVMRVLPMLPSVHGLVVMLGASLWPSALKMFHHPKTEERRILKIVLDVLAFLVQVSVLLLWPILIGQNQNQKDPHIGATLGVNHVWPIPIAMFLISIRYWENYVDKSSSFGPLTNKLDYIRKQIRSTRTKLHFVAAVWKCGITILMAMALLTGGDTGRSVHDLFDFSQVGERCKGKITWDHLPGLRLDWVWVYLINFAAGLAVYSCARTAAKVHIQRVSYALPLTMVTPALFFFLIGGCEMWHANPCAFAARTPGYLFFNCHAPGKVAEIASVHHIWIFVLWALSQLWITWHIWFPTVERLARTEKLFMLPLWDGVVLEQHLLHNRTRNDEEFKKRENRATSIAAISAATIGDLESDDGMSHPTRDLLMKKDRTPFIYLCATMWHETDQEMIQILKSIYRLDVDQAARRNAQNYLEIEDPDYYEFEGHIFFDDAFEPHGTDGFWEYNVNDFVKSLVKVMDIAGSSVHGTQIKIPSPIKYPAPYGGRLEWTLPGGNKIIAHLKDKVKIRHKKRWSQCMYMYYMLGFRLWAEVMDAPTKQRRADNTFLLALDGDVDFQPIALQLLVDLMKKDEKVGAACGRIHPIGAGPMVWYQKFEYALGHWMQKATEHVLGCVLCSPGCFSLFRGSALMDDNVMKMYTTISTEPLHYVQYDQGEDRWLCTLLLQQGYRVEYCAASDALTYAPEGFNEFYNQRRRWTPSTMANIMDLLMSWKRTIAINENISLLYIIYQVAIFVSSVIGPGTIFLMIVGALQVAFGRFGLDMWQAFLLNFIPVFIFVILLYTVKSNTQLFVAQVLTAVYSLVQMLVLVGILIQMRQEGVCSPTFIFFMFVAGTFILAACLHPQEFFCLVHGVIYFLSIPSMYMLLIMYALTNMHVVSWGTREVTQTKAAAEEMEKKKLEHEQKLNKSAVANAGGKLMSMLNIKQQNEEEGFNFSVGDLFRCVCCPRPKPPQEDVKFKAILHKLDEFELKLEEAIGEKHKTEEKATEDNHLRKKSKHLKFSDVVEILRDKRLEETEGSTDDASSTSESERDAKEDEELKPRDDMINPKWIEDADLLDGPQGKLNEREVDFFKDLIAEYLYPLESNKIREEKVAIELKDLRNKASFAFFLMNAIFVLVVFTLQIQKNETGLTIPWPCGNNLNLEPIGFMFLIFFGVIMCVQICGMVIHRLGTFLHIVATTSLDCLKKQEPTEDISSAIVLARQLGRVQDDDNQSVSSVGTTDTQGDNGSDSRKWNRRKTVIRLTKESKKDALARERTIDGAFRKRFQKMVNKMEDDSAADEAIGAAITGRKISRVEKHRSVKAIRQLREKARTGRSRTTSMNSAMTDLPNSDRGGSLRVKKVSLPNSVYFESEGPKRRKKSQRTSQATVPTDKANEQNDEKKHQDYLEAYPATSGAPEQAAAQLAAAAPSTDQANGYQNIKMDNLSPGASGGTKVSDL